MTRWLQDSNNSMQISTGLITITYTRCGPGITTTITHSPSGALITSVSRLIEKHRAFCDKLKSALEDNRDYFEVILSGYLFIMDQEEIQKFVDWFSQLSEAGYKRLDTLSVHGNVDEYLRKQRDEQLRGLFT